MLTGLGRREWAASFSRLVGTKPASMTRFFFMAVAVTAVVAATPVSAQFDRIFGDGPPRPPADIPEQNAGPPDRSLPDDDDGFPYRNNEQRPPVQGRSDVPPAEPLPAPMSLPPASRPGAPGIQSAPLPALPGAAGPGQTNPPPADNTQPAPQRAGPPQMLPGLPPGIRQPRGTPQQPADAHAQPEDEVVEEPPPQKIANPTAVFSGLDKITGRIISFDVAINETVQFGALQVTPRVCYSRPPTETAQTDAFVEVDEVTLQGQAKRIFTGWMFAASPGLHAVEHPIYDVWLTDCKGGKNPALADVSDTQPATKPARQRQPAQRRAPAPQTGAQQQSGSPRAPR